MDADGVWGVVGSLAIFAVIGGVVAAYLLLRAARARREGERLAAILRAAGVAARTELEPRRVMPERTLWVAWSDEGVHRGRRLVTELAHATRYGPRRTFFSLQVAAPVRDEGRIFIVTVGRTIIPWFSIMHRSLRETLPSGPGPQGTGEAAFDAVFDTWAAVDVVGSTIQRMQGQLNLAAPVRAALLAASPRAQHAIYMYDGCFVAAQVDAWPVEATTVGEVLGILDALAEDAPAIAAQLVAAGAVKLARQS